MADDYESMTVAQLKDLLKEQGLPVSGKKADLIERLAGAAEEDDAPVEETEASSDAEENDDAYHYPRYSNKRDIGIFKDWVSSRMNYVNNIDKLNFYFERVGKSTKINKYRNIEWDKPSPTIVAHLSKDGLLFIHPDPKQSRTITVREAALLQSFPEDYEFVGNMPQCYKMIGNAVPPKLASVISKVIYEIDNS